MGLTTTQFMKNEYPDCKSDLFAAFIERCTNLAARGGAVAMITMQSWMFLTSYEKLRTSLLTNRRITSMLHLGARAFDSIGGEVVSSTAFVLTNQPSKQSGDFVRLVDGNSESEKAAALTTALAERTRDASFYRASGTDFAAIPGSPIVYWLSEKMRGSFATGRPLSEVATIRQGLATTNNGRFTRWWWEISWAALGFGLSRSQASASLLRWFPYNKGGEYRKWYGNQGLVVNWQHDGREIKDEIARKYPYLNGNVAWVAKNQETYFLPSVSWSKVSSGAPTFRAYPVGFIYDVAGTSIFAADDGERAGLLSFGNSQVAFEQLAAVAPTLNYEVGQVAGLSVANASDEDCVRFAEKAIATAKADWDSSETSWNFECNPLVAQVQASRTATDS